MKKIDYSRIDILLEELFEGDKRFPVNLAELYNDSFFNKEDHDEYTIYIAEIEGLNLAYLDQEHTTNYRITPFGREVHKAGGWVAYNEIIEKEKSQELELRKKEVDATISAAKSASSSKNAAWVSILISIMAMAFSIYSFIQTNEKDKKIEELTSSLEKLQEKKK